MHDIRIKANTATISNAGTFMFDQFVMTEVEIVFYRKASDGKRGNIVWRGPYDNFLMVRTENSRWPK